MKNAGLGVLALLFLAGGMVLYRQQAALAERLDALERRPLALPKPAALPFQPREEADPGPSPAGAPRESSRASTAPSAAVPPPAVAEAFAPAQREAIAREVERQVERRSPGVNFASPEDPVALMEKELGLSPAQKIRIAELWARREEEQRKLFQGDAFTGGPAEHLQRIHELEERYETAIKRELDFSQQEKYAQLKKDGRLMPGVVFRVHLSDPAK
jgi:hypothetical protein